MLLAAFLCYFPSIATVGQPEPDGRLAMTMIVRPVGGRAILDFYCSRRIRADACTVFFGPTLQSECSVDEQGRWHTRSTARATAVMFLLARDPSRADHERLHLADIRDSLRTYLDVIDSDRFSSEEECRTVTATRQSKFVHTLRQFIEDTNLKRDPAHYRKSSR